MCGCKAKWGALVALAAIVAAVVVVRRGCAARPAGGETAPEPPPVMSAAERTQSKIEERMADTNYVAGLEALAKRGDELNALRAEAQRELEAFRASLRDEGKRTGGSLPPNPPGAADTAQGDPNPADAAQGDDDPALAAIKQKLAKIDEAIEANRRIAEDFIAARQRQQGEKGMEAERAAAEAGRKAGRVAPRPGAGREAWRRLPPGVEPPNTNRLEKAGGF